MADARDKRAAEIQDSIRQVLFQDWDPIGVNDNPKLADEYDSYIAPVYCILTGTRSEEDVIRFLARTEHDEIGTGSQSPERLRHVARKLLGLNVTL